MFQAPRALAAFCDWRAADCAAVRSGLARGEEGCRAGSVIKKEEDKETRKEGAAAGAVCGGVRGVEGAWNALPQALT